jgi:DNA-directed RNA polymerase subunit M/transcription elongation factor TFIIS
MLRCPDCGKKLFFHSDEEDEYAIYGSATCRACGYEEMVTFNKMAA